MVGRSTTTTSERLARELEDYEASQSIHSRQAAPIHDKTLQCF